MKLSKNIKALLISVSIVSLCSCSVDNQNECFLPTYYISIWNRNIPISQFESNEIYDFENKRINILANTGGETRGSFNGDVINFDVYVKYDINSQEEYGYYDEGKFLNVNSYVYDSRNNISYAFKTESKDYNNITEEISNFVQKSFDKIQADTYSKQVINCFTLEGTHNYVYLNKPFFKIEETTYLWKYRYSDEFSFYILKTESKFIPGYAISNSENEFDKKRRNYTNQLEITPERIVLDNRLYSGFEDDEQYIFKSGEVSLLESFPNIHGDSIQLISPALNRETIGYSFVNGFDTNFNYDVNDKSCGTTIKFPYNKKYSLNDPILEHKFDLASNTASWEYRYENPTSAENQVTTYYLFQMNNINDFGESELLFNYHHFFEVSSGQEYYQKEFNNYVYFRDLDI